MSRLCVLGAAATLLALLQLSSAGPIIPHSSIYGTAPSRPSAVVEAALSDNPLQRRTFHGPYRYGRFNEGEFENRDRFRYNRYYGGGLGGHGPSALGSTYGSRALFRGSPSRYVSGGPSYEGFFVGK